MINTSYAPWPLFTAAEADAVRQVLLSNKVNYWTGTECREFEREFADWCGSRYAIALMNGTVALDLALQALGVGPGDEVVVTPRSFIASISCVVNAGATPVFADVDGETGNITAASIEAVCSPRTKAVICVHLAGWPCDMDPIMTLAERESFFVIEDCAQAHGAHYKGKSVGSIGHISAWSFCQDKIMTTGGEGGMVTTNDEALWRQMWAFKDHGKSYEAVYEREHPPGFRWLHESFGTNWRMTEMQAVIGRIQLTRMPEWTRLRKRNADILTAAFSEFVGEGKLLRVHSLRCNSCPAMVGTRCDQGCVHAYYKYYAFVQSDSLAIGWDRDRIIAEIATGGVPCFQGSCSEVYLERAFDDNGLRPAQGLPIAKELGETSLMFLVHPTLSEGEMATMASVAVSVFERSQA